MQGWMKQLSEHLYRKSVWAIASLEHGLGRLLLLWIGVAGALSALRIAFAATPVDNGIALSLIHI